MGMRITGNATPVASQSSVAQWQKQQAAVPIQPAPTKPEAVTPSKPTATTGNHLNVVA